MEHQDAAIRKLLDEMRLMEARLCERISGRCDDVERHLDECCEEPCDETPSFDKGPIFNEEPCFHRRLLNSDPSSPCDWVDLLSVVRAVAPSSRDLLPPPGIRAVPSSYVTSGYPREDRELVQPLRRVESATRVESSVTRASSTELDREFIVASAFITASSTSGTSALEAGARVDTASEPEFPPRATLGAHPDYELRHVEPVGLLEGAVVRPLLEELERQHSTAQRVIVARGQLVLHRQYQLDSSPLDSCIVFVPERPADREMVEASAVMVVWAYDTACDRVGVEEVKHACEVGCSGGEMCLFTDLLGDLLCRIHRSPNSLMLVAETTIGTNSTEIAGIVRSCAKTAVSVGTTQQAKEDPIYTKVGSILGLRVSTNMCLMNCFKLIQSCFSWDAVPHRQPWPPPHMQVEFGCGSADLCPIPWPSFTTVGTNEEIIDITSDDDKVDNVVDRLIDEQIVAVVFVPACMEATPNNGINTSKTRRPLLLISLLSMIMD
jgi:hypothetical protein